MGCCYSTCCEDGVCCDCGAVHSETIEMNSFGRFQNYERTRGRYTEGYTRRDDGIIERYRSVPMSTIQALLPREPMLCPAPNPRSKATLKLCDFCLERDIRAFMLGQHAQLSRSEDRDQSGNLELNFGTVSDLKERTRQCMVCSLVWSAFAQTKTMMQERAPEQPTIRDHGHIRLFHAPGRWTDRILVEAGSRFQTQPSRSVGIYVSPSPPGEGARLEDTFIYEEPNPLSLQLDLLWRFDLLYQEFGVSHNNASPQMRILESGDRFVDYDLIQEWLKICIANHSPTCGREARSAVQGMPIWLIDVDARTKMQVNSSNASYVALSYCLGEAGARRIAQSKKATWSKQLPEHIPQTIADAMTITRMLGLQYLWVDQYCINQDDEEEKQRMIRNMNTVYEGADLTICAVGSPDVESGILGVSKPFYPMPQYSYKTSSFTLVATGTGHAQATISQSAWAQRGWTLQEVLLSRRCICFDSFCMFLWCKQEILHELVELDVSAQRQQVSFNPAANRKLPPFPLLLRSLPAAGQDRWTFAKYRSIVESYTARALSFESDAAFAIAGLMKRVEQLTDQSFFHWIPLGPDFVLGLLWRPYAVIFGNTEEFAERRPGFPSWSWLGWRLPSSYHSWYESGESETWSDGQKVYEAREHEGLPDKMDLYAKFIIPRSARCLGPSSTSSLDLKITTEVANIGISFVPSDRKDMSDRWVLLDNSGQRMQYGEFEHYTMDLHDPKDSENAWLHEGVAYTLDQRIPRRIDCSFFPSLVVSNELKEQGASSATFIFLQQWRQVDTGRQIITEYIHPETGESMRRWPYVSRERIMGDRVWLMMLHPNATGTMERAALLFIPSSYWQNARKQTQTISIV